MPLEIAPPSTDIEIISMACSLAGKESFNTIAGGGAFARDAQKFYYTLVSAELGSNRWRFAQDFKEMATLTTLTPSFEGWLFYWDMPADLIMLHRLDPKVEWEVFGKRILTKTNQSLTAIYSKNIAVTSWPPAFALYIVYALADMLAPSVTNSDRMVARIQAGLERWQVRALFADGQNTPPRSMQSRPYIDARFKYRTTRR